MCDDIVKRMRDNSWVVGNLGLEAADEIERLRAEIARLTLLSSLWESEFVAASNQLKRLGK